MFVRVSLSLKQSETMLEVVLSNKTRLLSRLCAQETSEDGRSHFNKFLVPNNLQVIETSNKSEKI